MSGRHDSRYKGKNGLWTEGDLQRAVKQVLVDKISKKKAAKLNNIPRPTLIRHIKNAVLGLGVKKQPGRPTVLSEEQEDELVDLLQDLESRLFGLTVTDVRRIVFTYCQRNAIQNTFSQEDGMAGRTWMNLFLSRHSQLSIRKPEAVSIQRAIGFNKAKVDKFFDLLEKICFDSSGDQIVPYSNVYNVDESGFSCVQKAQKIVATKGKKNIGTLTSGERGKNITVVCCMSATGSFVPPVFIFPRVRMKNSLMDHSPSGSVGTCTKSGWINEEAFEFWFDHFLKSVRPQTSAQPVLLIFDGHSSHTRNLNVVLKARENNVVLVCLPSHCTHRLQPLDVAFFRSLNSYYDDECRKWLRDHQGRKISEEQIPELFGLAYGKSATVATAVNGFKKAGIAPLNRDVFSDADFCGADMTDQPLQPEEVEPQQSIHDVVIESTATQLEPVEEVVAANILDVPLNTQHDSLSVSNSISAERTQNELPSTSQVLQLSCDAVSVSLTESVGTSSAVISFREVIEASNVRSLRDSAKRTGRKRKVAHAAIVTSSPFKRALEESLNPKGTKRQTEKTAIKTKTQPKAAKKGKENMSTKNTNRKTKTDRSRRKVPLGNGQTDDVDEVRCLYCTELYTKSIDKWVCCDGGCQQWAHELCAGKDNDPTDFICELCSN
jgi:hypothetical protein